MTEPPPFPSFLHPFTGRNAVGQTEKQTVRETQRQIVLQMFAVSLSVPVSVSVCPCPLVLVVVVVVVAVAVLCIL